MNKENVAKLIAALRSGNYGQTKGKLSNSSGTEYCCLGVACDISGLGRWDNTYSGRYYVIEDENGKKIDDSDNVLPEPVARWLGMAVDGTVHLPVPDSAFDIRYGTNEEEYMAGPNTALTELNDEGMTFNQIADMLANADTFEWEDAPKLPEVEPDDVDDYVDGDV